MKLRSALLLCLCAVGGCQQETLREIDWAKAALARNPDFEIMATDEATGVFTVRDTGTGQIRTLKLQDLVAAPVPARKAARPAVAPVEATPSQPAEAPHMDEAGETLAADQTTAPAPTPETADHTLASGPGYRISRGRDESTMGAQRPLEGPGYRVEKADPAAPAQRTARPAEVAPLAGAEHRTDPIICQGDRLMRIDGETLSFTGDAVIAEKGCDLYISNAHIQAGGVGIVARQARVHIANSTISGLRASYEASQGAEIYVAQSTFTGVGRRFDGASMTDLGGNSYATH